jgi:pimeloyl-ACP methyl ester carboxylesterase
VRLSATEPTTYTVRGWLCRGEGAARHGGTVLMMVSGLTYDHRYFDSGYRPARYSWVRAATRHGYSTFVYDRLGVGASGKPPADQLTVQHHAYTAEQIVRRLRTGALGGHRFANVVGVGHSLGSGILQYLAGTSTDPAGTPDHLVLSGWLHRGNPVALANLATVLHEAGQDPAFASAGLPDGYLTTIPGTRAGAFYNTAFAEPAAIARDEATKQTGTLAERLTLAQVRASTVTLNITVPVLLSVGQVDTLQCDEAAGLSCATPAAVMAREAASYGPRACLTAAVVPGSGHSVNFHRTAPIAYATANRWLDAYTGSGRRGRDGNGCLRHPAGAGRQRL